MTLNSACESKHFKPTMVSDLQKPKGQSLNCEIWGSGSWDAASRDGGGEPGGGHLGDGADGRPAIHPQHPDQSDRGQDQDDSLQVQPFLPLFQ